MKEKNPIPSKTKTGIDLARYRNECKEKWKQRQLKRTHTRIIKNLNEFIYERINSEWSAKKISFLLICESESGNLWYYWEWECHTEIWNISFDFLCVIRILIAPPRSTAVGASFFHFTFISFADCHSTAHLYIMPFYQYFLLFYSHRYSAIHLSRSVLFLCSFSF